MPQKAKMTPEYKKNDASALFFKRTDKNFGLHQNALENVGPPAPAWKGRSGRSVFIFCILEVLALDNPRTAVYNKDKERRWLHSGQLPLSVSHFEKNDRRSLEDYRGGHFSCHFIFWYSVLRDAYPEKRLGQSSKWFWQCQGWQWPEGRAEQ